MDREKGTKKGTAVKAVPKEGAKKLLMKILELGGLWKKSPYNVLLISAFAVYCAERDADAIRGFLSRVFRQILLPK